MGGPQNGGGGYSSGTATMGGGNSNPMSSGTDFQSYHPSMGSVSQPAGGIPPSTPQGAPWAPLTNQAQPQTPAPTPQYQSLGDPIASTPQPQYNSGGDPMAPTPQYNSGGDPMASTPQPQPQAPMAQDNQNMIQALQSPAEGQSWGGPGQFNSPFQAAMAAIGNPTPPAQVGGWSNPYGYNIPGNPTVGMGG